MLRDVEAALSAGEPVPEEFPENVLLAAVAAMITPEGELLFIRRAERAGDPWSGHMAFPGGRFDPGDAHLRRTAERETWEEVGLALEERGRPIGRLADLWSPVRVGRPRLRVSAFVFALPERPVLRPNEEVAETVWIDLRRLLRREGRGTLRWPVEGRELELPAVRLDGYEIWGITLRLVDDLIERLEARPELLQSWGL